MRHKINHLTIFKKTLCGTLHIHNAVQEITEFFSYLFQLHLK
jgi:hypothetical protein